METEKLSHEEKLVQELSSPLFTSRAWLKVLGILLIVYGIFIALSIIGILLAWLPIWLGILLFQSASKMENAYFLGEKSSFIDAQKNIARYFTIYGILAIIGILISVIIMIVLIIYGFPFNINDMMQKELIQNDFY